MLLEPAHSATCSKSSSQSSAKAATAAPSSTALASIAGSEAAGPAGHARSCTPPGRPVAAGTAPGTGPARPRAAARPQRATRHDRVPSPPSPESSPPAFRSPGRKAGTCSRGQTQPQQAAADTTTGSTALTGYWSVSATVVLECRRIVNVHACGLRHPRPPGRSDRLALSVTPGSRTHYLRSLGHAVPLSPGALGHPAYGALNR